MERVLIIAAHPDDDILGCGGIMAKHRSLSTTFKVIFIAEGSSCRYRADKIQSDDVIEVIQRRNDSGREALKILGVKQVEFYNLPCGRLDQTAILDINQIIEKEIQEFKPDTIFTHSNLDANNDHQIVHRSTLMATRPNATNFVNKVYSYEILSSSEWRFTDSFKPNFFVSLSEKEVELKWKALSCYESEIKPFPFPRSTEGIFTLARYRGMQAGVEYAEAFSLIREIYRE